MMQAFEPLPRRLPVLALWMLLAGACGDAADDGHATGGTDTADRAEGPDAAADAEEADSGTAAAPGAGAITVLGPITAGNGAFTIPIVDLAALGYTEEEYFFEGEASAYAHAGEATMDGKWQLEVVDTAAFKTRLLVRRPSAAADFNGTVVIEWLNVSGGVDADPGFIYNHELLLRDGYAWVGVSAQAVGIQGGGFSLGAGGVPLKDFDPERYGTLLHPGDGFSYDIYGQAARIVRGEGDMDVLGGLEPEQLIAYGESQSAARMVSYVNGVHPLSLLHDGFFIHSRGVGGASFDNAMSLIPDGILGGSVVHIRDDLDEPVLQLQTETDVHGMLGFLPARQPDRDGLRTWEVTGTAHADQHMLDVSAGASSDLTGSALSCPDANDGPQHFVVKAALHALNGWIVDGAAPAMGEVLMVDDSRAAITDEHGNTLGGIRTPAVDVPIAIHSGNPPPGSTNLLCSLFGSTTPFAADKLAELYPSHQDYVDKVQAAAEAAVQAGFVLPPEAETFIAEAEAADVP
ncbi:MAG: alpha/beta hydrolase domain-containing protein [Myxococcales bacterium]|nr:alpha/beta hydrolase domain-containing protein [Myxococcales bacterium]